mmetsp:Transcript_9283/g.18935  ORF Transcript_9283/g.18935 Transcript_9283/m.18935 type:complete len:800 (-) Transcript_9283:460-2859(-)
MCAADKPTTVKPWGVGMSQEDFMSQDECLVLNYNDEVIGADNKYNVHKFIAGQPKGTVHRAFSVMLFDAEGKLLLQQRAASKVTFPRVWTNTCCSHPLTGMTPSEEDVGGSTDMAGSNEPIGIKRAAVRKLMHEVGTKEGALSPDRFKYMGRVHYWAADTVTHGPSAPWGEHEIDYLLLCQLKPGEMLELDPNEDEVMAIDWVSADELKVKMADSSLLWSPWFRVIAAQMLFPWWENLAHAFMLAPYPEIRRFDGPVEHRKTGGCHDGDAGTELGDLAKAEAALAWSSPERRKLTLEREREARRRDLTDSTRSLAAAAANKGNKQGGYGKVPTHSHSKLDQLLRPVEVAAGLYLKFYPRALPTNLKVDKATDKDGAFADEKLGQVSRSFAAVIRQLPSEMAMDILIFYLVLRALDTIEDDMETFKANPEVKCEHLRNFGRKYLGDENWNLMGVGEGDEKDLLEDFGAISRVFNKLPAASREVITDITIKMGDGMAEYVSVDMGQGTTSLVAYERYCHMVAGLVGEGLSRAFVARGLESKSICGQGEKVWPFCASAETKPDNLGIANSMGLFLQKTNIIRDYLEDYVDHRAFWPQDVWKRFARTSDLGEFARPTAHGGGAERYPSAFNAEADPQGAAIVGKGTATSGLSCLNFLVADALELVPDCLTYLELLRTPEVFRFSAIPQVMAMATLNECFDNPKVFSGVVKIRKGLTARLLLNSGSIDGVHVWFNRLAKELAEKCPPEDPSRPKVLAATSKIINITAKRASAYSLRTASMWFFVLACHMAILFHFGPKFLDFVK